MKPDRRAAAIAEVLTLAAFDQRLLQSMVSLADQQDEPSLVSQVMSVRDASPFPMSALPFTHVDAVLRDQFPINNGGIFARRYRTCDVPVPL